MRVAESLSWRGRRHFNSEVIDLKLVHALRSFSGWLAARSTPSSRRTSRLTPTSWLAGESAQWRHLRHSAAQTDPTSSPPPTRRRCQICVADFAHSLALPTPLSLSLRARAFAGIQLAELAAPASRSPVQLALFRSSLASARRTRHLATAIRTDDQPSFLQTAIGPTSGGDCETASPPDHMSLGGADLAEICWCLARKSVLVGLHSAYSTACVATRTCKSCKSPSWWLQRIQ